ncbi:MAG: hypothetical protein JW705_08945 [Methanosarcinaceae archaeon]|nr:hypothetical protein [Methanosarcinaceae archaeon]
MLGKLRSEHPWILRVELIAKESNHAAISLYRSLGFVMEGWMEKRIRGEDGGFEDDVIMLWMNSDHGMFHD